LSIVQETGKYPFNPDQVILNSTAKLTVKERDNIVKSLPNLSICYKNNGQLVDKAFYDCHIANNDIEGSTLKEDLITCRQCTIRLMHRKTQERLQSLLQKSNIAKEKEN
jgi:hypothetical protein